jgi:hypothetical protein
MLYYHKSLSFVCFDTDDSAAAAAEANKGKIFTQDDVNAFLAKEKRKTQETQKQLAAQLSEYKQTAELSSEAKVELEKQIEDLQKQYMTVEERARQTSEKVKKVHEDELVALKTDRDSWQQRYTASTIESNIIHAASANKAVEALQILAILRPATKLTEKLDEQGKPTGIFEPRVDFQDMDKDAKPIVLNLSVPEAVKRMTELPQHGNLFQGTKTGGLGGSGSSGKGAGKLNLVKIARDDPALYRKLRKEQPEVFASL